MTHPIQGIHHVTSMASDANANNAFFTRTLGLRRVKMTVNFDVPEVYHFYFGDRAGSPGTLITYFPFPDMARGKRGTGETDLVAFSVPAGSLDFWQERLAGLNVAELARDESFGQARATFEGPDGERVALIEADGRDGWQLWEGEVDAAHAVRGVHCVLLRLAEEGPTADLLQLLGYRPVASDGGVKRFAVDGGSGAGFVDLVIEPETGAAEQGAGSVHHVAFAVADDEAELAIRRELLDAGHAVTKVIDRDYFHSIYFRSPGGVLFEIATNGPGFARDEDADHLGEALKLPSQHEHLRERLESSLVPIVD